ncbi:phage portal protein [Novosphingobium chloroacetimidivorans]|uniref:phage portal protein n=1 Tax=Novosphingobium chloroacetimidivorans TaxID=1428314 RepID=UPI001619DA9A|nr:phage portal protein [Novosphingobium chloroacetimidivorans]
MSAYKLSREAAAAEQRKQITRYEAKEIIPVSGFTDIAFNNRDDFSTNRVTLADFTDRGIGNAVGLAATWACVNLLAGTIASLPLMVYRTDSAGVRLVARDHPLYYVLHDSPNYDQTAVDFWEFNCAGIELHGNSYAEIEKRSDGSIYSLTPIRPDAMCTRRLTNGDIEYSWNEDGKQRRVTQERILHIRGFGGNPLGGASTLSVCRQIFTGALNAEQAANGMFANGARPSGILSAPQAMKKEQRQEAEQLLIDKFVGAINAGRPMLLDNGLTWTQLTLSPEDAQMLESRRFSVEEICRVFGVPPHMIGHTENSTSWGTGLEQQTLGFNKFTLRRRVKRIEQALSKQLLTSADRVDGITIEFNLEGLLRGDSAGRAAFYTSMTQMGAMTINEVRTLENLPPVAGGDVPRMQMQNVPITQAGQEETNGTA